MTPPQTTIGKTLWIGAGVAVLSFVFGAGTEYGMVQGLHHRVSAMQSILTTMEVQLATIDRHVEDQGAEIRQLRHALHRHYPTIQGDPP